MSVEDIIITMLYIHIDLFIIYLKFLGNGLIDHLYKRGTWRIRPDMLHGSCSSSQYPSMYRPVEERRRLPLSTLSFSFWLLFLGFGVSQVVFVMEYVFATATTNRIAVIG